MTNTHRKAILLETIAAIQNEVWLQKIEKLLSELQDKQDNLALQFATNINPTFDITQAIAQQQYKTENIQTIDGFWTLPDEEEETITELLAQLTR
ncbi:MAG: hypothetical protein ACOVQA_02155 [Thermoflexibacteraceae bacterium]